MSYLNASYVDYCGISIASIPPPKIKAQGEAEKDDPIMHIIRANPWLEQHG
jgi:hypothetical protein